MINRTQPLLEDSALIALYWDRYESAIGETDRKYGGYLYSVAYQMLHNRQDSEECRNDTYKEAWEAIPPARPRLLQSFLAQITRGIAINRYKERTRQKRVPSELTDSVEELSYALQSDTDLEQEIATAELGRMINAYVRSLSETQRYIFVGRYYMARPVKELATELGMTQFGVYKHLKEIKKGLKAYLEERGETV